MLNAHQRLVQTVLPILIITPLLFSCSSNKNSDNIPLFIQKKNTNALNLLINQFSHNIEEIWGMSELIIAGPADYIKYSNGYQSRSHINFEKGIITIETISNSHTREQLRKAIISTLLMGNEIASANLYSSEDIEPSREPFLYNQVVDQSGEPIRWEWRAEQFADYLINTRLKRRVSGKRVISYIVINLVANHLDQRAKKFLPYIHESARKYNIDPALILAIIKVESSFNPYAVSRSNAIGLMQVQQHTAGRDVFKVLGKSGEPSRDYLFDPKKNIDMGTAYLLLLKDRYLNQIKDPLSRYYAMVTAYNGGAGSVLRVFSQDRNEAAKRINGLSPEQVYKTLVTQHPAEESRNYLRKVHDLHKNYSRYHK